MEFPVDSGTLLYYIKPQNEYFMGNFMTFSALNGVSGFIKRKWLLTQDTDCSGLCRGYYIRKPDEMDRDSFKEKVLDTMFESNPKAFLVFLFNTESVGDQVNFYGTNIKVLPLERMGFDVQPIPDQVPVHESFDHA